MPFGEHAPRGLLGNEKSAESADGQHAFNIGCDQVNQRATGTRTGVEDHHLWRPESIVGFSEQALDVLRPGDVAAERQGARFAA